MVVGQDEAWSIRFSKGGRVRVGVTIIPRHAVAGRHAAPVSLIDLTPGSVTPMTTATPASPDRRGNTSLSKYDDVEVGHWFRTPDGSWGPGVHQEVVDLEWSQSAGGVIVYLRNHNEKTVHMAAYGTWREGVRATLPPWAE